MFFRKLFKSQSFVFQNSPGHGHEHSPAGAPAKPGDVESKPEKSGVPIRPEDNEGHIDEHLLPEEIEILKRPYSNMDNFDQNPEKKASKQHINDFLSGKTSDIGQVWRFLSVPRRMQYMLIKEPNADIKRRQFIRMPKHRNEIHGNYAMDLRDYAKKPAFRKVPVLAVPIKERNEIKSEKSIFMMGGKLAAAMSNDEAFKNANAEHISGTENSVKAFDAFNSKVGNMSESEKAELNGSTVVMNFEPDMFTQGLTFDQLKDSTDKLLNMCKDLGMNVVMGTPLRPVMFHRMNGIDDYIGGENSRENAKEMMKKYKDYIGKAYQGGLIKAVVGTGTAMTKSKYVSGNPRVDKLVFYKDSNDLSQGLSEEGIYHCASGMIDGINMANGKFTGRTSAGSELNYYGSGVKYDAENHKVIPFNGKAEPAGSGENPPTIELIPGYESRQSVARLPEKAKYALWALAHTEFSVGMGGIDNMNKKTGGGVSLERIRNEASIAEEAIEAITDPKQKEFAKKQLMETKASLYYGYAFFTAVSGDNRECLKLIQTSINENAEYLNGPDSIRFKVMLDILNRNIKEGADYTNWMQGVKFKKPRSVGKYRHKIEEERKKKEKK